MSEDNHCHMGGSYVVTPWWFHGVWSEFGRVLTCSWVLAQTWRLRDSLLSCGDASIIFIKCTLTLSSFVCGYIHCYALIYFVIFFDWYHSPCLSWDPPNVDYLGHATLLGRGATPFASTISGRVCSCALYHSPAILDRKTEGGQSLQSPSSSATCKMEGASSIFVVFILVGPPPCNLLGVV